VEWAKKFPEHEQLKGLYQELVDADVIKGACQFCSGAFGVTDELNALKVVMLDEASGHPDIGKRVVAGQIPMIL
jgi:hypothetical protein